MGSGGRPAAERGASLVLRAGAGIGLAALLVGAAAGGEAGEAAGRLGLAALVATPLTALAWISLASIRGEKRVALLGFLTLFLIIFSWAASCE